MQALGIDISCDQDYGLNAYVSNKIIDRAEQCSERQNAGRKSDTNAETLNQAVKKCIKPVIG